MIHLKSYSKDEVDRLLQLIIQYDIPVYDSTTLHDMEVLINHAILKEYGKPIPVN